MKYLWIVMIVLAYVIWSVTAIKDIVRCWRRYRQYGSASFDDNTCVWVAVTIIALFLWSFTLWFWD